MKKYIMLVSAMALLVTDIFAMDKSPRTDQGSVSNITKKQKLKRVDSRARLPILKDKDQLPAPMSTEEYIDMLKKFLNENNQLIDPTRLIEELDAQIRIMTEHAKNIRNFRPNNDKQSPAFPKDLKKKMMTMQTDLVSEASKGLPDGMDFLEYEKSLNHKMNELQKIINEYQFEANKYKLSIEEFERFAEGTDQSLPSNRRILDVSCPNIIRYAKNQLNHENSLIEEDPSDLPEDKLLQKEHLKWIINYFEPFVEKIQNHEIDPDDKYDSGLTDEDINLLIKLTVGPNRVFGISNMSEAEKKKFHDEALTIMLQNATGFQRTLSLLIMSVLNSVTQKEIWHLEIDFIKGEKSSFKSYDKVHINEADDDSLDSSLFHEITHSFHQMLAFYGFRGELISNISILNSRDLNLIDQYFPMLRPNVMNPILKEIESLIDKYFGHDFEKITEEEKQKLTVVVLEPIVRNAMMNGFGNFVFPNYKSGQSLLISTDMLTTKKMAICAYLSSVLEETELYPTYNEEDGSITISTNISDFKKPFSHPLFEKVKVTPTQVTVTSKLFETDSTWNNAEEKLTMQGNTVLSFDNKLYYIQDRQNEHIYLLRSHDNQTEASPIASPFRYHEKDKDRENKALYVFRDIEQLCPSLELGWGSIFSMKEFYSLSEKIKKAFDPSMEEKYGLPGVESMPYQGQKATSEKKLFDLWKSALDLNLEDPENEELTKKLEKNRQALYRELNQAFSTTQSNEDIYKKYDQLKEKIYINEIQKRIKPLIDQKKDINAKNEDGDIPLTLAVCLGYPEIIKIFLENGANFKFRDELGNNLMYTAKNLPLEKAKVIIKMLLDKGLSIDSRNLEGNTILHSIALTFDYSEKSKKLFDFLTTQGANLEAKNNKGETPLLYIVNLWGSLDSIKKLIDSGAKIDAQNYIGETALHYIVSQWNDNDERCKKIADLLIKKGLDINSVDNKGDTPLHTIARRFSEQKEAINFLVKKGANPNIKNYDGKTPLELAKEKLSPNANFLEH